MDRKIIFLLVFGIVMFGIRLFNINEAIYDDESNFAYSLTVMDEFGFNQDYYSPQPLNLVYKPFIALFGLETWVFRIVPWLFGIINTIFVYIFAWRNWGKKAAFWAAFLMLVAFYPTLASLQFDVEGNLVMFCVLLMFFSYLEYEKAKSKGAGFFWQILAGIGLGIAVVCKYNAVYLILVLDLYSLIRRKWNFKQSFKDLFLIYLAGFILFCGYILLAIIASPNWLDFVGVTSGTNTVQISLSRYHPGYFSLLGVMVCLMWSTLLLFGFYLLSLFKKPKKNLLLLLWITITILFYTFGITYGSMDRYFMHTIPALAVLGGIYVSKIDLKKKHLFFSSLVLGAFTLFLFFVNSLPVKYVARFPELYFNELKNLNLNFLFSYTSASGPTFGVNFATIFWSFLIGLGCLFLYLVFSKRKTNLSSWFFVGFLSVSLAFNVFLVSEYIFHPTGVDVSKVKWEMIDYVRENKLSYPIYTNDQGIQWYFEHNYLWRNKITDGFGDNEIGSDITKVEKRIKKVRGTILLLHWPPLPEKSPAWEVVKLCKFKRQFYSKKILIGEIYTC
ncbi:MAG: glycosyltransferase family 39 protein [Nanoarchaeota archaeon]